MSRFESYLAHQLNINMKRLLAFGCSNTYGHGLEDCYDNSRGNKSPGLKPSKFAWPEVLADNLGRTCLNLSNPGASMKEVVHKIHTTKYLNDDLIVVMLTPGPRSCIISKGDSHKPFRKWGKWHIEQILGNRTPKPTKLDKRWITDFADDSDIWLSYITYINYVYLFFKEKNVKAYYFCYKIDEGFSQFLEENKEFKKIHQIPICTPSLYDIQLTWNDVALDGAHPGKNAHATFANKAFEYISQNG